MKHFKHRPALDENDDIEVLDYTDVSVNSVVMAALGGSASGNIWVIKSKFVS